MKLNLAHPEHDSKFNLIRKLLPYCGLSLDPIRNLKLYGMWVIYSERFLSIIMMTQNFLYIIVPSDELIDGPTGNWRALHENRLKLTTQVIIFLSFNLRKNKIV